MKYMNIIKRPAYVSECAFLKAKESLMDWTDADSLKRL